MKKKVWWNLLFVVVLAFGIGVGLLFLDKEESLRFNPQTERHGFLVYPNGDTLHYRAYEQLYYVKHVADSTCQFLNIYVPASITEQQTDVPLFFRTYVGGYRSSAARTPSPTDATGRALKEGFVVVIPGSRGWNSTQLAAANDLRYIGCAPAALLDLKAAIRYLRYNDALIPGDATQLITDGTSAGGALSALLGSSANHPIFNSYLQSMGAADATDEVFMSVCYCPITNLNHADMAYEWLYNCTNNRARPLSEAQVQLSNELASTYPAYLNELNLKTSDSILLTDKTYRDYLRTFLMASAQRARNEGVEIPAEAGIVLNREGNHAGEFVLDLDLDQYLNYVASHHALKEPPAFDRFHVLDETATPENRLFANESGNPVNFTDFSLRKATGNPDTTIVGELEERVVLMNPFAFIQNGTSSTAPFWYIRHGALDRDIGFDVPLNLYTLLMNKGINVNFAFAWNRDHSGDYHLDDLFSWISSVRLAKQSAQTGVTIPLIKSEK